MILTERGCTGGLEQLLNNNKSGKGGRMWNVQCGCTDQSAFLYLGRDKALEYCGDDKDLRVDRESWLEHKETADIHINRDDDMT